MDIGGRMNMPNTHYLNQTRAAAAWSATPT